MPLYCIGTRRALRASQRSSAPSNIVLNGDFTGADANWAGFYYSGKYPSGGKATFNDAGGFGTTSPYDGIEQVVPLIAGKYYELAYTVVRTSGTVRGRLVGGTINYGADRSSSGTFTERLLVNAGNNTLSIIPSDANFQGTVDDVSLWGPYNTSSVGGA